MKPDANSPASRKTASSESSLLEGILTEAREEAERIVREAEEQARKKRDSAATSRDRILAEAGERSAQQRAAILKEAESSAAAEVRRILLRGREALYDRVLDRLREKVRETAGGDGYAGILRGWIVEAALGLGGVAGVVETPRRERALVTPELLNAAEAEIRSLTGHSAELSPGTREISGGPGIIVYNREGTLAFDNRLEARIRRRRREIMRILRDALDPPRPEESEEE